LSQAAQRRENPNRQLAAEGRALQLSDSKLSAWVHGSLGSPLVNSAMNSGHTWTTVIGFRLATAAQKP
jgi:hypothetical protein